VSAGIGVIGMASPMLQEIFAGKLIGLPDIGFNALSGEQKAAIAAIAAGFTGLLSLFNIGGRFFWASLSDHIGRKATYYCFFLLAIALYALAPTFASMGSKLLLAPSASSCRCMAAASRPCRPISPTCSERSSSAPFTGGY
jgi:MFS family permease